MGGLKEFQGENLKELLKREGISQKEFAKMLKTSETTVSRWVKGHASISDDYVTKIMALFPDESYESIIGLERVFWVDAEEEMKSLQERRNAVYTLALRCCGLDEIAGAWVDKRFDPYQAASDITLTSNNQTLTLTPAQWDYFVNEIGGYVRFRLQEMMKRGAW